MSKARGLADLGNVYNDGALSNRNLVINGAMQVAQRGTSVTGITGGGYLTCDRMELGMTAIGTWTVTQESDGPVGFANSYKVACTTANAAPAAGAFMFVGYKIEGQDLQQLAKGSADAQSVTLSFWVKSNVLGTYQVTFLDADNTRNIAGTYTVDASATWEYKTITVAGDTTGPFANDNGNSLGLEFWLDSGVNFKGGAVPTAWEAQVNTDRNAGSNVNLADTIGNYFQITGVQLEVGDTATPFEHRSYGQELALCQRYYEKSFNKGQAPVAVIAGADRASGVAYGPSSLGLIGTFAVTKRASPTMVYYKGTAGGAGSASGTVGVYVSAVWLEKSLLGGATFEHGYAFDVGGLTVTAGYSYIVDYNWTADAEL